MIKFCKNCFEHPKSEKVGDNGTLYVTIYGITVSKDTDFRYDYINGKE